MRRPGPWGPTSGLSNLEFVQKNQKAVTRVTGFCWSIGDNGTLAGNSDIMSSCEPQFAPIRELGVEVLAASFVAVPALLNNTWRRALLPLAEYAAKYNWTGIHAILVRAALAHTLFQMAEPRRTVYYRNPKKNFF